MKNVKTFNGVINTEILFLKPQILLTIFLIVLAGRRSQPALWPLVGGTIIGWNQKCSIIYTKFEIEDLIDSLLLTWELKRNQIQDAEEKLFLKCSFYINQLYHLLKISLRNTYFSGCPTYLTAELNLDLPNIPRDAIAFKKNPKKLVLALSVSARLVSARVGFIHIGFRHVSFNPLGFSPIVFSPTGFSPFGFSPIGFSPVGFSSISFTPICVSYIGIL